MLSGVIFPKRSYPAMPRAGQLVHQRFIIPGPLVQRDTLLNFKRPKKIGSVLFLNALNPTHVILFFSPKNVMPKFLVNTYPLSTNKSKAAAKQQQSSLESLPRLDFILIIHRPK